MKAQKKENTYVCLALGASEPSDGAEDDDEDDADEEAPAIVMRERAKVSSQAPCVRFAVCRISYPFAILCDFVRRGEESVSMLFDRRVCS
jgi:hypothetical protein